MSFDGQHVVVIGGSAGIGEAAARAFAALGAVVTITGRSKERLDQAARRIGHPVQVAELDATDRGALDAFFAATGTADHLVLTASPGAVGVGPVAALDEAALQAGLRRQVLRARQGDPGCAAAPPPGRLGDPHYGSIGPRGVPRAPPGSPRPTERWKR